MKFGFIAKHLGIWATGWLCGALGVSRGGFYAWLVRPRSQRSRSDEELAAKAVRHWLGRAGVKTLFIKPGSPWENGYCESFNSKLRDELLNGEIFTTLREAQVLI